MGVAPVVVLIAIVAVAVTVSAIVRVSRVAVGLPPVFVDPVVDLFTGGGEVRSTAGKTRLVTLTGKDAPERRGEEATETL